MINFLPKSKSFTQYKLYLKSPITLKDYKVRLNLEYQFQELKLNKIKFIFKSFDIFYQFNLL